MAAMDDDWVDVAEEFCAPAEWVLLVGDEGSMAAVFFGRAAAGISAGVTAPIPIVGPADATAGSCGRVLLSGGGGGGDIVDGAAPAPISIPGPADAMAASRGRVLLSSPWSRYYVFEPATGDRHALPLPRRANPVDAAIACDASGAYWVVCAFAGCFEIYASAAGKWREVPSEAAGGVVRGSAASFDGMVFWKLGSSPGVLVLNVNSGATCEIGPPPHCSNPAAVWQLGVAAGHLSAAVRIGDGIELYGLVGGPAWNLIHEIWGLGMWCGPTSIRLLRFESENHEVLLRMGDRVLALDVVEGIVREARLEGAVLPERDEKIVPWCRTTQLL